MTKENRRTPPEVYREVCERSGGIWTGNRCLGGHCEFCNDRKRDWRGLCFAHYPKHRQMGGTTNPEVHSPKNIKRSCYVCHDEVDGR